MSDAVLSCVTDVDIQMALCFDKGAEAKVISWSLEDFTSKFDGTTSLLKNARIKYSIEDQPKEVCYVLKANSSRGELSDTLMGMLFSKEHNFYDEVIPSLNTVLKEIGCAPLSFPKCFLSSLKKGKEMMLLENLREQGYEMRDKTLGIDAAHASLVLKELAKLHAASVLLQAKTPDKDLLDRFHCLQKETTQAYNFGEYAESCLDIGLAMFKKFGDCERVIKWIEKIKPNVWKMQKELLVRTSPFALIIHGDCWINNLLFRYDASNNPIEVKFLDVQLCRKASLALDLQHFFTMNLTDAVRRPNLPSFFATYHTAFDEVMKAGGSEVPFTLEELRQEYMDRGFYGVLYGIMWLPNVVRRPKDSLEILDTGSGAQISEMDNVLRMVDDNPLLKPRIMSIIEEWTEYGLIS